MGVTVMTREISQISQESLDLIKEIAQWPKTDKIKHLVHFTPMTRLSSILKHGLLGRNEQRKRGTGFQNRGRPLANAPDAISCSITFPNHLMFSDIAGICKIEWVVLVMDAEVLWTRTKRCAFFEHNAASSEMVRSDIESHMGPDAFKEMFPKSTVVVDKRRKEKETWTKYRKPYGKQAIPLPSNYTTDVQAEVLVLDPIEPGMFLECAHQADIPGDVMNIVGSHPVLARKKGFFQQGDFYFGKRPDWPSYGSE